jgi:hypothetical protein
VATFLTTAKMAPELAARIEDSVRGRRGSTTGKPARGGFAPLLVSGIRIASALAVVAAIATVLHFRHQDRLELESARASLLEAVRARSASLTPDDRGKLALVESWLARFSGVYEGDLVAEELRGPGALGALLKRPAIYVRGAVGAFRTPGSIADAAAVSSPDALVTCLVDPPASRTEKIMLTKVRSPGSGIDGPSARVYRLHDGQVTLPLLESPWAESVRLAPDLDSVARLRRQLEKTPVERGKEMLGAGLLLVAMDEPGSGGGITELDGERPHDIRVGLVDLASARVLLRVRKHVDPSWISESSRSVFAGALDACGLAMDARDLAARRN